MDLSSKRYIKRSFCEIRFDQRPERLCLSGSGLPRPDEGSSDRSISLSNLQSALCSRLSFSRMLSYASQVLPSNTSDLIHLLFSRFVALPAGVGFKGVQGFLLSLPVIGTHYNKCFTSSPSNFERLVSANYLFYNGFQVVSKFVHANGVHVGSLMYGNAVQLYTKSPNKAKHRDSFFVAPAASLQSRVCWRR
jgi:hypothetical protein